MQEKLTEGAKQMQNSKENSGKKTKPQKKSDYNAPFAIQLRTITGYDEKKGKPTKVTQSQLADAIGVTRQTISDYLLGNTQPNAEVITKIAQYFGVSSDYLLGLTQSSTPLQTEEQQALRMAQDYTGLQEDILLLIRENFEHKKLENKVLKIAYENTKENGFDIYSKYYPFNDNSDKMLNAIIKLYFEKLSSSISEYLKSAEELKQGIKDYKEYRRIKIEQAQKLFYNIINREGKDREEAKEDFEVYLGDYVDSFYENKDMNLKAPLTATNSALFLLQDAIITFAKEQFDATELNNEGLQLLSDYTMFTEIELLRKKVVENDEEES